MNSIDNRLEKINDFLNTWVRIKNQNSSFSFNNPFIHDQMYYMLVRLGVSENDKKIDNDKNENFNNWKEHFRYKKTDCFVDPNWSYFCQFINDSSYIICNRKDHIKIYVPLDSRHLKEGAKQIFDFLERMNIKHESKIGKNIRFDDIVIRLIKEEDAEELFKFINNNKYIQEGLIEPNPFAYSQNGIAIACDGKLSYNSTVSDLLVSYLKNRELNNQLEEVCATDFYNYVVDYYNKSFVDKDFSQIIDEFGICDNIPSKLLNYEQVIKLFLNSFQPKFNFKKLIGHYQNNILNPNNDIKKEEYEKCLKTSKFKDKDIEKFNQSFNEIKNEYGQAYAYKK